MAKTLQFRDGSEDGPTGKFLLAVTHEAHRRLAPDQAEGVVAEVRDHLGAQVEMQVMNGRARSLAERDAVQGFGSARQFVRGVSHSLHDTRKAAIARTATLALTTVTLAGMFFFSSRFGPSEWAGKHAPLYLLPIIGLAIVCGSWMGWRALPRQYALLGASFVTAVTLWAGFDTVTLPAKRESRAPWLPTYSRNYSRTYMRRAEEAATIHRDMAAADVAKLQAGLAVFSIPSRSPVRDALYRHIVVRRIRLQADLVSRSPELQAINRRNPALVGALLAQQRVQNARIDAQLRQLRSEEQALRVAALTQYSNAVSHTASSEALQPFKTNSGYLAPRTFLPYHAREDAFVSLPMMQYERGSFQSAANYARSYQQSAQQTAPVQMASFVKAQLRWQTDGRRWLNARQEERANQERALDTVRRVEAFPFGFNSRAALVTLTRLPTWLFPLLLVLLNFIPAFLARQTRRAWDGWVWRIRSTA